MKIILLLFVALYGVCSAYSDLVVYRLAPDLVNRDGVNYADRYGYQGYQHAAYVYRTMDDSNSHGDELSRTWTIGKKK